MIQNRDVAQIATVSGDLVTLEEIKDQILANFKTSQPKPGSKSPKSSQGRGWTGVSPRLQNRTLKLRETETLRLLTWNRVKNEKPSDQVGIQDLQAAAQLEASQAVQIGEGNRENTGEVADAQGLMSYLCHTYVISLAAMDL